MEIRKTEGLQSLGHKTVYKNTYDPSVLETFQNLHTQNDYWVRFNCPEFTQEPQALSVQLPRRGRLP